MAKTTTYKDDRTNFNDCLKPVSLSNLDNEEFYTVYGLYRGIKTYDPHKSNGNNYKKEYISIFNNYYNKIDYRTISFPSMIVFCKVSTFKKDNIMYDKERDSENYNFNYNKTYKDIYDPLFNKSNIFDGKNEEQTYTKTIDDGISIYVYHYYYIYVSDDIIHHNNNNNANIVHIEYNKKRLDILLKKQESFTKKMLIYFHKYLLDKENDNVLPYVDMSSFFYQECQQHLDKQNITQQEYINKIKWYFEIIDKASLPYLKSCLDLNKSIEIDCLSNTHTKEEIEFKSSVSNRFTSGILQNTNGNHYNNYNSNIIRNTIHNNAALDEIELDITSYDNRKYLFIYRDIHKQMGHTFGDKNFKFTLSDIIGFKIKNSSSHIKQKIPHFKNDSDRVLMKHYMIIKLKENINLVENDSYKQDLIYTYDKLDLLQRYLYLVNFLYMLKYYNNSNWFKFDYTLTKIIDTQHNTEIVNIVVDYKLYFHHSLRKYLLFNNDSNEINLTNPGTDYNILVLMKFMFGNYVPSFILSSQIINNKILSKYYRISDTYTQFYKPPLSNSYYENNYSLSQQHDNNKQYEDLKLITSEIIQDNLIPFNIEENGINFNDKLNQYFIDNKLDNVINITLFNYQKRNIIWMSELENKVDNNQLYIDTKYLQFLKLNDIIKNKNFSHTRNWENKQLLTKLFKYNITINGEKCYYLDNKSNVNTQPYHNKKSYLDYNKISNSVHNDINIIKKNSTQVDKTHHFHLSGGLLCDDVGLGKTLSTITHLVNIKSKDKTKLDNDPESYMLNNLIILPPRLLKQWGFEIEKYVGTDFFNVKIIASITDIKKMYKKNKVTKKVYKKASKKVSKEVSDKVSDKVSKVGSKEVSDKDNKEDIPNKKEEDKPVFEKADIYLISINLFNNNNYNKYIFENHEKALDKYYMNQKEGDNTKFKYDINSYFDIFQIKWNRIIIDEVHENICNIYHKDHNLNLSIAQRKLVKNIMYNIQSNYRWGLSATPFQKDVYNNYGYITWLSKSIKNDMLDTDVVTKLYNNNLRNFNDEELLIYHIVDYLNYYLSADECHQFQNQCISKTRKIDVEKELNIPIVTEEIIPITLSNIEMNIYKSARSQVNTNYNYRYTDRLKRLFQLCTNICISDEDVINMGIDVNNPVSLEELNKAMINTFSKKLKTEEKKLSDLMKKKTHFKDYTQLYEKIKSFTDNLIDKKSHVYNEIYGWVRSETKYIYNSESERNNWSKFYRHFKTELMDKIDNCNENTGNLILIVSDIMCQQEVIDLNIKKYFNDSRLIVLVNIIINNIVKNSSTSSITIKKDYETCQREIVRLGNQVKLFENNDFMKEKTQEPCPICWCDFEEDSKAIITKCRHVLCIECFENLTSTSRQRSVSCPECREPVYKSNVITVKVSEINESGEDKQKRLANVVSENSKGENGENKAKIKPDWEKECISKYGTKMCVLIKYLKSIFSEVDDEGNNKGNRTIIFSQYDNMLKLIGKTLAEFNIKNVYARGNVHVLNKNIDSFKRDDSIRVIMLSSEHSNSGNNLTEASHIIMVDVLNMDKKQTQEVEKQAIGRAVRLGQKLPVKIIRLITQDTIESEYYEKNKYDIV
jgi:SNF2 family DNA or RNA helicase